MVSPLRACLTAAVIVLTFQPGLQTVIVLAEAASEATSPNIAEAAMPKIRNLPLTDLLGVALYVM